MSASSHLLPPFSKTLTLAPQSLPNPTDSPGPHPFNPPPPPLPSSPNPIKTAGSRPNLTLPSAPTSSRPSKTSPSSAPAPSPPAIPSLQRGGCWGPPRRSSSSSSRMSASSASPRGTFSRSLMSEVEGKMSSTAGVCHAPGHYVSSASKSTLNGYFHTLRSELIQKGIDDTRPQFIGTNSAESPGAILGQVGNDMPMPELQEAHSRSMQDLAKNPRIPPRVAMQALVAQQSKLQCNTKKTSGESIAQNSID